MLRARFGSLPHLVILLRHMHVVQLLGLYRRAPVDSGLAHALMHMFGHCGDHGIAFACSRRLIHVNYTLRDSQLLCFYVGVICAHLPSREVSNHDILA